MNKIKVSLIAATIILAAGCARQIPTVPYVENHPASMQKKMQAAHHWDLLAEDVAEQLKAKTVSHGKLPQVYVRTYDQSPFAKAFNSLLLTQLYEKGFRLSEESQGGLILEYDTQVVRHKGREKQIVPGTWTALGATAWVVRGLISSNTSTALHVAGTLAGTAAMDGYEYNKNRQHLYPQPDTEIIVSVSLRNGKNILARTSDIYYINDPDDGNYRPIKPVITDEQYARRRFNGMSSLRVNK